MTQHIQNVQQLRFLLEGAFQEFEFVFLSVEIGLLEINQLRLYGVTDIRFLLVMQYSP